MALACLVAESFVRAAPPQFVTILKTDAAAPDVPGCTFRAFNAPILNNTGHMAFIGSLNWIAFELDTTNDEGIWVGYPDAFQLAAREADPVPGLPGVYYQSLTALRLDEEGHIAFAARLKGSDVGIGNDTALLAGDPGSIRVIAREGDPAPGLEPGVFYGDLGLLNTLNFVIGRPGEVAFLSPLTGNVGFTNNQAVWCGAWDAVRLLAREGHPAPHPDLRLLFNGLIFESIALNPTGLLSLSASVKTNGTGFPSDCIWIGTAQGLELAGQGGLLPSPLDSAPFTDFDAVTVNSHTQFCFVGTIRTGQFTNDSAIVAGALTNLVIAARENCPAPGMPSGVRFDNLALVKPVLSDGGHVAFAATVSGPDIGSTNATAIWAGLPDSMRMVCRRGDPAPGLPAGIMFSTAFAGTFDLAGINRQGHIAYISHLEGAGVTIDTDQALWAGQPGFESLLIRRGDWLNLGDGQNRKVFTFDMVDQKGELQVSGGQDGRSRSLNDRGQYTFHVTFVAGQGEAILFVPSVLDPDQNGVPAIAELAHGLTDLEPAANIHPSVGWQEGALVLQYRRNTLASNVSLEVEESANLDGSWETSMAVSSLDSDQSGLPAGVERRRAILANPSTAARFYRIAVRPDLKLNPPAGAHAELL